MLRISGENFLEFALICNYQVAGKNTQRLSDRLKTGGQGAPDTMAHKHKKQKGAKREARAHLFAALGDETRLRLVSSLSAGEPASIAQLTEGSRLTRQAITKHLRVLENAGLVRSKRLGRESIFFFDPQPLVELRGYLERVSRRWEEAPAALKSLPES